MRNFFICFALCMGIFFANIAPAEAVISETADLAINAAQGLMQTDDEKLEREIINGLQNPAEQENLQNYIEKTRPIIQKKTKFFQGTITTALYFMDKIPLVGGMAKSATLTAYMTMYERDLEKLADSDVTKKFAELREHNIDAGQGLFEVYFDFMYKQYDKDASKTVVAADATLLAAKGKQQSDRYKSSAAAIARVLESAGIEMLPEDVGDICSRSEKNSVPSSPPAQTQQKNVEKVEQPSSIKADNEISIAGVSLGDSINSVNKKFGEPTKKDVAPTGFSRCSYGNKFAADYNHDAAACLISYSSDFSTSRGIHVGSTVQNFISAYGEDYSIYRANGLEMYEYRSNFAGKDIITRFAVKEGKNLVEYISIRYAD